MKMKKVEIIKSVTSHIENGIEKIDVVGVVTGITEFGDEIGDYIRGETIRDQKFLEKIKSFMTTATKTTKEIDFGIFGKMCSYLYE
jgi:hypothetical protein